MTDHEVIGLFFGKTLPVTVSMSKAGTFLRVGDDQHKITDRQAELLWNAMLFHPAAQRSPQVKETPEVDHG